MNLNIFFNTSNEENIESEVSSSVNDFMDSPVIWVGTFEKLISNYHDFGNRIIELLKIVCVDLNQKQIQEIGEKIIFNRAYKYIDKIDLENQTHIEVLKQRSNESLLKSLNNTIKYFENIEDYEKCARIINILNKINNEKQRFD